MVKVIEAQRLVKHFGGFTAVAGIDFSVGEGECFGFLGPNGAGKTTTLRMVCCVSPITGGKLLVLGRDVRREGRQIKARLGVVPQEENLDPDLTVTQNLMVYSRYYDLPSPIAKARGEEALALFALLEKRISRIDTLSTGQKKRLLLARAWLHRPTLLIMDEPTTGLDPQARLAVWDLLRRLQREGATIVLSTHYMEEASALCNRVVIMHLGKILAQGPPQELIARHTGPQIVELHFPPERQGQALSLLKGKGLDVEEIGNTIYLYERDAWGGLEDLLSWAQGYLRRPATLEDVFLRLTGRGLKD